ncbi:zeta toxin family protein [Streptomyces sp. NPDC090442]|uniref:zeta toxin family protein n=1 Tax=Streptomyces sp. NPDC090442 TaxID=3365962 RepID=UPI0038160012
MSAPPIPGLDELTTLFATEVRHTLTAPSQESPELLVLGGPQGSRKTSLRTTVPEQLGIHDPVIVDGDDFYSFLPEFDPYAREVGMLAAMKHFNPAVKELTRMTREHVRQHSQNVVLVGPYTAADFTRGILDNFPNHRRSLAYTAMHPALSQLGTMHRHHQATQPGGIGYAVLPSIELQSAIFTNTRTMLDTAQSWDSVSALYVVDPLNGRVAGSQERGPGGRWQPGPDIRAVLDQTRYQPWSEATRALYREWRAEAETANGDRWVERLASVDQLAAPMLATKTAHLDADAVEAARLAALSFPDPASAALQAPSRAVDQSPYTEAEQSQDSSPER